jgi:F-type H+-transporting ATPase subunit b
MDYQEVAMDTATVTTTLGVAASEHPLIDIDLTVLLQFGLFLVMFFAASALLFKPYLRLREQRAAGIDGARGEAERMTAEADAKLATYEKDLAVARARSAEETRKVRAEAAAHEREVTEKARSQAAAALAAAQTKVRSQTEAARAELMPQADALARKVASRLLGREVA